MSSDLNPLEKFSTPDLLAEIARRMGVLSPAQLPNKLCRPVIISGPSGVGKGTLVDMLIKQFPNDFGFSVSHTTRQPRPGETEGVHYHYTTRDRFLDDVKKGNFLEYAEVHGNLYGTNVSAVSDIRNSRRVPLIEIDVQGCMQIFKKKPFDAQYVFVTPPSLTDLEARLRKRGSEKEDNFTTRLRNAEEEIRIARESRVYDAILINKDLQDTYAIFKALLDENRRTCAAARSPDMLSKNSIPRSASVPSAGTTSSSGSS